MILGPKTKSIIVFIVASGWFAFPLTELPAMLCYRGAGGWWDEAGKELCQDTLDPNKCRSTLQRSGVP